MFRTGAKGNLGKTHLNHMIFLVQLLDSLPLSELEQRDLGRDQPAEEVHEHHVIAEGDDILDLPKDRPATQKINHTFPWRLIHTDLE